MREIFAYFKNRKFWRKGQGITEYAILFGFVAVLAIALSGNRGGIIGEKINHIVTSLTTLFG